MSEEKRTQGFVEAVNGNLIRIVFDGPLMLGELIYIHVDSVRLKAEIIEIYGHQAKAQVFEDVRGVSLGSPIECSGELLEIELGPGLLSLVVDGVGAPLRLISEKAGYFMERGVEVPTLDRDKHWEYTPITTVGSRLKRGSPIGYVYEGRFRHDILLPFKMYGTYEVVWLQKQGHYRVDTVIAKVVDEKGVEYPISMMQKWPIKKRLIEGQQQVPERLLETGTRIIDTLFPMALGSTTCSPGPFGAGKTVVQQQISKYALVDLVVLVACGERAGEVVEVITDFPHLVDPRYKEPLMNRTVIICNTSSMPVAAREASIYIGMTIAEYYRQMGLHVLLLADSTSRWAQAIREVSARLEEIPGEEAFPAYLASRLHAFYERAGVLKTPAGAEGSITILGAVSPAGGNFDEPVTQATLMVVDAFLCLSRSLSDERRYPAIDRTLSWSYNLDIAARSLKKRAPQWKTWVSKAKEILEKGEEIAKRMEVVGEEGIQIEDFVIYLKKELFDFAYLQQNAFDREDTFCPMDRQIEMLSFIYKIFVKTFCFTESEDARKYFLRLQNEIKNVNLYPYKSEFFERGMQSLNKRIEEMDFLCK